MVYGLTLPERTVRSAAALISGAAGESVALIVPRSFQDSKSYRVFVQLPKTTSPKKLSVPSLIWPECQ